MKTSVRNEHIFRDLLFFPPNKDSSSIPRVKASVSLGNLLFFPPTKDSSPTPLKQVSAISTVLVTFCVFLPIRILPRSPRPLCPVHQARELCRVPPRAALWVHVQRARGRRKDAVGKTKVGTLYVYLWWYWGSRFDIFYILYSIF
jgi:hypothetical protein